MAPSSPRSPAASRDRPCPPPPRPCCPDADASTDTNLVPPPGPVSLLSRLEAVDRDAMHRKFALYGRQHARVDHISGADSDPTTVLQSAVLLQEDGRLATRLDDVSYLLDGLLPPARTQRGRLAQARSVLELLQLLQDAAVLQAVELSSQRRRIRAKLQQLLRSGLETAGYDGLGPEQDALRLALAVLVMVLAGSSVAHEFIEEKVLDAVVRALKGDTTREGRGEEGKVGAARVHTSSLQQRAPVRKTCLKRKQARSEVGAARDGVLEQGGLSNTADDGFQTKLEELLQGYEEFYVGEEVQISTADILCAALSKLLQMDGDSAANCSSGSKLRQNRQDTFSDDPAADMLRIMRARKRQLVRNGGVDVLVDSLSRRIGVLETLAPSTQVEPLSHHFARALHGVSMLLRVFEHATFLSVDIQQYISQRSVLFALLLKLTRVVSNFTWEDHAPGRWQSERTRMSLLSDILLSTLRVLINLTHHSVEAARHVHDLGGMQLLATCFSKLWGLVNTENKSSQKSLVQDKWEFDSCLLLLSAMVNSIEFSVDNRDALAGALLYLNGRQDGNGNKSSPTRVSACALFTQFFQVKLDSYLHLIDISKDQGPGGRSAISMEDGNDDWSPEDVILGGCTSLLLGYLMKGSSTNSAVILNALPDKSPQLLLRALAVFAAFHSQIDALTPEVAKSVLHVEDILKSFQGSGDGASDRCKRQLTDVAETAPNNAEIGIDHDKAEGVCTSKPLSSLGNRPLKNLCSNIDDSDTESNTDVSSEGTRRMTLQDRESVTPAHTPPRSPGRKRLRAQSPMTTPAAQVILKTPQSDKRSVLTAVLPDGTLSSPVVARLLRRTRQLVDEFDAEFSKPSPVKKCSLEKTSSSECASSPFMMLTMDVTCRDNGSDGLDVSLDVGEDSCNYAGSNNAAIGFDCQMRLQSKRRKKETRDSNTSWTGDKNSLNQGAVFDLTPSSTPPCTPLRVKNSKVLLHTPTRNGRSPGFSRESPLLSLTPTKAPSSTPLRVMKSAEMLRTPTRSPILSDSPVSSTPPRRKAKSVRVPPSSSASAVFDFTD